MKPGEARKGQEVRILATGRTGVVTRLDSGKHQPVRVGGEWHYPDEIEPAT